MVRKKKFVKIKYRVFFRVLLKDLVFNDTICIWGHFSCSTGCNFFLIGTCINGHPVPL